MIEAKRRGTLPLAPCSLLLGCRDPYVTEGHSGLSLPAAGWLASPSGTVYGGVLALFADIVLTGAATTVLGAGLICSPLDLKIQFLHPVWPDGRLPRATAAVEHHGHRFAEARAEAFSLSLADYAHRARGLPVSLFHRVLPRTAVSRALAERTN